MLRRDRLAGDFVASLRARKHGVDVETLQGGRQKAHRAQLAGTARRPNPTSGNAVTIPLLTEYFVEFAARASDGDNVL